MDQSQESHLQSIKDNFAALVDAKYRKGAAEHGSDLLQLSAEDLIDEAISEAIDQMVYLITLKEKIGGQ
jgi:hypothetical protein